MMFVTKHRFVVPRPLKTWREGARNGLWNSGRGWTSSRTCFKYWSTTLTLDSISQSGALKMIIRWVQYIEEALLCDFSDVDNLNMKRRFRFGNRNVPSLSWYVYLHEYLTYDFTIDFEYTGLNQKWYYQKRWGRWAGRSQKGMLLSVVRVSASKLK